MSLLNKINPYYKKENVTRSELIDNVQDNIEYVSETGNLEGKKATFYERFIETILPKHSFGISKSKEATTYFGFSFAIIAASFIAALALGYSKAFLIFIIPLIIFLTNPRTYSLFPLAYAKNDYILNVLNDCIEPELPSFCFDFPDEFNEAHFLETTLTNTFDSKIKIHNTNFNLNGSFNDTNIVFTDFCLDIVNNNKKSDLNRNQDKTMRLINGMIAEFNLNIDENIKAILLSKKHSNYLSPDYNKFNLQQIDVSNTPLKNIFEVATNNGDFINNILNADTINNLLRFLNYENTRFSQYGNFETYNDAIHNTDEQTLSKFYTPEEASFNYSLFVNNGKLYILFDSDVDGVFDVLNNNSFVPEKIWHDINTIKQILRLYIILFDDEKKS